MGSFRQGDNKQAFNRPWDSGGSEAGRRKGLQGFTIRTGERDLLQVAGEGTLV